MRGGWRARNRLRKWSRGSYAAQSLRRSLADVVPLTAEFDLDRREL